MNLPSKRVWEATEIDSSNLVSISSVVEIDQNAVNSRLANGGSGTPSVSESGVSVVEIPMASASIGYTLQYAEKNGKWIEFYVPSVVFETDKVPKS